MDLPIITLLTYLLLLPIAAAWCALSRDFESTITLITLVSGILVFELLDHKKRGVLIRELEQLKLKKETPSASDLRVFKRYIDHFPPNSKVIKFLRDHDLAHAFHQSEIEPLWEYVENWEGPDIEFIDNDLEATRLRFDTSAREFVKTLSLNTFSEKIRPGYLTMDYKEVHQRPKLEELREKLNALGSHALSAFEEFHRLGKWTFRDQTMS